MRCIPFGKETENAPHNSGVPDLGGGGSLEAVELVVVPVGRLTLVYTSARAKK